MNARRLMPLGLGVLAIMAMLVAALAANAAPSKSDQGANRVAIVTDIGGLNDKGFNHLSYVGLQRAVKQLNIQGRTFITNSANDRTPNLAAAAQQVGGTQWELCRDGHLRRPAGRGSWLHQRRGATQRRARAR